MNGYQFKSIQVGLAKKEKLSGAEIDFLEKVKYKTIHDTLTVNQNKTLNKIRSKV